MDQETNRVTVDSLAQELSHAQASNEQVRRRESDDVRHDVLAALNRHGWDHDARPSVLRHIAQMHGSREITARHVGNDMPPHEANAVETHPDRYWLSTEDVRKVRASLQPARASDCSADSALYLSLGAACKELETRAGRPVSAEDMLRHVGDKAIMLYWDTSSLNLEGVRHRLSETFDRNDSDDEEDVVEKVPRGIYAIHFDGFETPDYFLSLASGDGSQWPSRSPTLVAPMDPGFCWELRERNPAIPVSKHLDDDYLPGSRVPRIAELRVDREMLDQFDDMEIFDGVGSQDVADMVEITNNDHTIDWEFWIGKMASLTAAQAARLMAGLDPDVFPILSFEKRGDNAWPAKERAIRFERLAESHHMTKATPAEWLRWADDLREPVHEGLRIALGTMRSVVHASASAASKAAADRAEAIDGTRVTKQRARSEVLRLEIGRNDRIVVRDWVAYQAGRLKKDGDTLEGLAARIHTEIPRGARGERNDISVEGIKRLIPAGITGGRAKNGKR
ncbi:hypothetical protein R69608_05534 [Paraburkholderia nemoris]|uniref:hypothetical protein n=1 Tax=Paraburkholderia nemoris TaxID=2793076 RepID=UPI00191303A5|nr:hypothetical protein [Paraburkholderia nemoris]MBK5150553.1 hypothetical protein [Burkholderia sp. R-69608]CAE6946196.1 hypothetical protein R69608_05534 [Paraburkholderia nemoris]